MAFLDENDLKKQIKSREFSRVYLIYGNEGFLKQYYVKLLAEKAVDPAFADFNLHRLGASADLNDISDRTSAFPMMGDYTCTVVCDFPLTSFVSDKGKTDANFEELLSEIPETSVLVFWMDTVEVDEKNSKWSRLIKMIGSIGTAAKLGKRSTSSLIKLLSDSAKRRGCTLSHDNAFYFIGLVGDDLSTLQNELEKVCAYQSAGEITRETIDKVVITTTEAKVFSLAHDIVSHHADSAFETLGNLFKLREEPIKIFGVLSRGFVDYYRVRAAAEKGVRTDELTNLFPATYKGRTFILTNASRDAGNLSLSGLHTALDALKDTDTRLKSTGEDAQILLEELVFKLLRIS